MLLLLAQPLAALNPVERFATEVVAPKFFSWFASSEAIAKLHAEHVAAPTVRHMIKGSPLAAAPDERKLEFARSSAGSAVSNFMKLEQQHIGEWKVQRIVEAAGSAFEPQAAREAMLSELSGACIICFSFEDCPWCLLTKERLEAMARAEPLLEASAVRVVELEQRGPEGKALRAAIALATGRTSMPSVWVDGVCVGGHTDGDMPAGEADLCLRDSPGFAELEASGALREMLRRRQEAKD
jgi:glutaredoxin